VAEGRQILFGYWPVISDEESASAAAKMAGLPVLFFGLGSIAAAFIEREIREDGFVVFSVVLGLLLIAAAFRIRSGAHGWLPFILFPMLGLMFVGAAASFGVARAFPAGSAPVTVWMGQVIGWLLILLVLGGLRGWWWKRRNKIAMRF
jgi:uncharacterized membrane protein YoaK (UPF0700 family)